MKIESVTSLKPAIRTVRQSDLSEENLDVLLLGGNRKTMFEILLLDVIQNMKEMNLGMIHQEILSHPKSNSQ